MKKVLLVLLICVLLLTGCGKKKTTAEILDAIEPKINDFLSGKNSHEELMYQFEKTYKSDCKKNEDNDACKLIKKTLDDYEKQKDSAGDVANESIKNERAMEEVLEKIKELRKKN